MSESSALPEIPLSALLECLLFVSGEPVSAAHLASALALPVGQVEKGLEELEEDLGSRGLRLQRHSGRFQLTTAPELAELVEDFLGLEATTHLSRAALETLAIIAYQQPVTRPQVDSVRGVNSDGVMKSLLSKGLLEEIGRAEGPGRPILYGTTPDFLRHFGLAGLSEMPPLAMPEAEGDRDVNHLKG
jgi:segregation and condensation protein B